MDNPSSIIVLVIIAALLIVVMFVMPRLRGRKQQETTQNLHALLVKGAKIKTIGGLICTIVELRERTPKDKVMIVEAGEEGAKVTLEFDMQSLYTILTLATGEEFNPSMLAPKPVSKTETIDTDKEYRASDDTSKSDIDTDNRVDKDTTV